MGDFNWGDAVLGFFGGDVSGIKNRRVARQKIEIEQGERKAAYDALILEGYDPVTARGMSNDPNVVSTLRTAADAPVKFSGPNDSLYNPRTRTWVRGPGRDADGNEYGTSTDPSKPQPVLHEGTKWITPQPGTQPFAINSYTGGNTWLPEGGAPSGPSQPPPGILPDQRGDMVPPAAASAGAGIDVFRQGIIPQESGGRPGIPGQMTRYGRPMGMTQMLPATAQEMAGKLGLPWRPELMAGKTPEAAQYQEQLGRAYYDQGLAAEGGDPRGAAMYYHGGPNHRQWGPKTRRYADEVMQRVGGQGQQPTQMSRARLIAEAQAAIRRGADPQAVHQRLQQMGIE